MLEIDDSNRKWWILAAMGGGLGVIILDETVVGVALPTIQRDLGLSLIRAHWVVNAYLLVLAGLVAAGGRLGDIFGLKRLTVAAFAVFGLASTASGFATDGTWLIAARAIQGIGGAVIFPASMAMIGIVFPAEQRGMALGIYGAIGTVFLALGPLLGGAFTEFLSWRWVFWINPFIAAAIIAVVLAAWVDPPRRDEATKLDARGLAALVVGLGLVVYAIMEGSDLGWTAPIIWVPLIVGAISLIVFVAVERRVSMPLIEVDLFRNPSFTVCNLVVFMAQFTKVAVFIFVALYFQHDIGMSAFIAGLALLAAVIPEPFLAIPSGRFADRYGARKPTLIGIAMTAAALIWIGIAAPWQNYLVLVIPLVAWGLAQPLVFVPTLRAVMNTVPSEKQGEAGGIALSAQLLGGTVGMTLCSAVFAATSRYWIVFIVAGVVAAVVLLLGWRWIEPPQRNRASATAAPGSRRMASRH